MINTPTVFILGAGASVPYGYPTGASLRASIIRNFCNDLQQLLMVSKIRGPERPQYMGNSGDTILNY